MPLSRKGERSSLLVQIAMRMRSRRSSAFEPLRNSPLTENSRINSSSMSRSRCVSCCIRASMGQPGRSCLSANARTQKSAALHRMRRLVSAERAGEIVFDFLLGVAAVLVAELNADAGGPLALRSFRRHPYYAAGHGQLLFLAHEIEQHEYLVAQTIVAVRRNKQAAVFHERHVGEVQRALILDGKRQQTWFITWTSQFLRFP